MKKLVKTAKQQFEEDLNNLTLVRTWKMCDGEIYHHCVNGAGHFILFREQDEEYKILMYHKTYEELVLSEEFLFSVTQRFIDGRAEIKQLYNWYASADHEDEPFNLLDVFMSDLEAVNNTYEDEYEEVPDVRIITAREQFECRLEEFGLLQAWDNQGCIGRIGIVEANTNNVIIFVHEDKHDAYTEFVYPPFEELRKDSRFCLELLGELVDNCDDLFFKSVSRWIHFGGNCPLDPVDVYFCANHLRLDETVDFEDKEEQPKELPDCVTEMNMYDPFNWLRESDNGTWNWIAEYCKDHNEYGYLDIYYRVIEGSLVCTENEFCKDMTMEEIKADYAKRFPLLLASVFENLANDIRNGDLQFTMNYNLK